MLPKKEEIYERAKERFLKDSMKKGIEAIVPKESEPRENGYFDSARTELMQSEENQFLDYLEFKERDLIIPKIKEILAEWDECVSNLNEKLTFLSKKF